MGERALDLRDADLAIGVGQKVDAMPRAQEQALVMGHGGGGEIDRACRPEPGQVLAPGPGAGKSVAGGRDPVARAAAAGAGMAERVGRQHPVGMRLGRLREQRVGGKNLLGRTAQRSGREPLVEVDPERRRLGQRVETGLVDELEQVLLFDGQRHGDTGVLSGQNGTGATMLPCRLSPGERLECEDPGARNAQAASILLVSSDSNRRRTC